MLPHFDHPVEGARHEDPVMVRIPGHLSDGGRVGGVAEEGVGGGGDGALENRPCVRPQEHYILVVGAEVYASGRSWWGTRHGQRS